MDEIVEKLAAIEHDRWAAWHRYASVNWTPENLTRWDRQMKTPYAELSEHEKESDRKEVMRYWPLILAEREKVRAETLEESCSAVCFNCAGSEIYAPATSDGFSWHHLNKTAETFLRCKASDIRSLKPAPEQRGEGK